LLCVRRVSYLLHLNVRRPDLPTDLATSNLEGKLKDVVSLDLRSESSQCPEMGLAPISFGRPGMNVE